MREYVKPDVAARALKISVFQLRKQADRGNIRYIRTPGGHRRYALADYIAEQEARCNDEPNHD